MLSISVIEQRAILSNDYFSFTSYHQRILGLIPFSVLKKEKRINNTLGRKTIYSIIDLLRLLDLYPHGMQALWPQQFEFLYLFVDYGQYVLRDHVR